MQEIYWPLNLDFIGSQYQQLTAANILSEDIYEHGILQLAYGKNIVSFEDCSLSINGVESDNRTIYFSIENDLFSIKAKSTLKDNGPVYEVLSPLDKPIHFIQGRTDEEIDDFFSRLVPKIFFADGSVLYGNHLIESPSNTPRFDRSELITKDWSKANIRIESQWSKTERRIQEDSIQYVFSKMIEDDFHLIIDDDGSGEVADLIGINETDTAIDITLFHLKFALKGKVSDDINNLYQVCGQAIKSVRWKYVLSKKLFDHILARNERKVATDRPSRHEAGLESPERTTGRPAQKRK